MNSQSPSTRSPAQGKYHFLLLHDRTFVLLVVTHRLSDPEGQPGVGTSTLFCVTYIQYIALAISQYRSCSSVP